MQGLCKPNSEPTESAVPLQLEVASWRTGKVFKAVMIPMSFLAVSLLGGHTVDTSFSKLSGTGKQQTGVNQRVSVSLQLFS